MKHHGDYCYLTDIGRKRLVNEDCSLILSNAHGETLMLVCDGMGGHKKGDVASRLAIDLFIEAFNKKEHFYTVRGARKWLEKTIRYINEKVYNQEKDIPYSEHMGTTLVACLLLAKHVVVANIGDSRAYILRSLENEDKYDFQQVTNDDTIAEYLVNMGRIKKEDRSHYTSRHILTNAIGLFPSVRLEMKVIPFVEIKKNHTTNEKEKYSIASILLCSDGLFSMVNKDEILSSLLIDDEVENKAESLILMANNNGGDDNIAIALWEKSN